MAANTVLGQEATPTPSASPAFDALTLQYQTTAGVWLIAGLIAGFIVMSRVRV